MNRRQKIVLSVTGIFLVLLLLVGLTYAYFLTKITGNENTKSISVTTANLALVYGDGNGTITGTNILPGTTLDKKEFTVKNEGNATTDYVVVIEDVKVTNVNDSSTTTFESNDFVYTLICTEGCNGVEAETTFPINGGILVGNSIKVGKTHMYELTVTYKETSVDQSNDMNKMLEAKVNIRDIAEINPYSDNKSSLAYNIINNAALNKNGTELLAIPKTKPAEESTCINPYEVTKYVKAENISGYIDSSEYSETEAYNFFAACVEIGADCDKINNSFTCENIIGDYIPILGTDAYGYNIVSAVKTVSKCVDGVPAYETKEEECESVEASLNHTFDDYGTSYYYRGDVRDNYLNFDGVCWRIVKINGDGTIKLVLEDQDNECSNSDGNWDIGNGNDHYLSSDENYYFDWDNRFRDENGILTNNGKKIESRKVCVGDTTKFYDYYGNLLLIDDPVNSGYGSYYDNYIRLFGKKDNKYVPSLICSKVGFTKINYLVSSLTADEVVFAGGTHKEESVYYLNNSYQKNNNKTFWTTSRSGNDGMYEQGLYVDDKGVLTNTNYWNEFNSNYRPSIILNKNTVLSSNSGDGTKTNPYVVE